MSAGAKETTFIDGVRVEMGPIYPMKEELEMVKANRPETTVCGFSSAPQGAFVGDAPAAIVGFGPSLADTWEQLRDHKTIITTSKAHDFLLKRGITPTYHVDVDPREHKAGFIGEFHPDVQYVLATHVHPVYVERAKLADAKVWLYHSQVPEGGPYEYGYVKVPGMFDAGLMAAKLAFDWGFRKQTWFGIDASLRDHTESGSHAGPHEGFLRQADQHMVAVGDIAYPSNALTVRQALFAEKMLRTMGRATIKITGDGMMRPFLLARRRVKNVS